MKVYTVVVLLFVALVGNAQTVGLIDLVQEETYDGYTLFDPLGDTTVYLIDNCGKLVHTWHSDYRVANSVYLLEDGTLLRTCVDTADAVGFRPGAGGRVELLDWDSNVLWTYLFSNDTVLQHHDVEPMPNGNILVLAWDLMDYDQAVEAGRRLDLLQDNAVWPDQVIEVEMVGTDEVNEVWRWRLKDHLIQDYDNTKSNYGVISEHPELVDFNAVYSDGNADWTHCNSVAYNADRDEIIISSRNLSEVYIIDHSTTTEEAAGHTGGDRGKGGDILYRWGKPENYGHGTSADRTLYGQHDAHWIPAGFPNEGKLIVFNNGQDRAPIEYSSVDIFTPPTDVNGNYIYNEGVPYGPVAPDWTYDEAGEGTFYAAFISGAAQLPNGNVIICDGPHGGLFEVNADGDVVWDYVNPITGNGPAAQGSQTLGNAVFRTRRYPLNYSGLVGDVTPGQPLELNPINYTCPDVTVGLDATAEENFVIYPNPSSGIFNITEIGQAASVEVFDALGRAVYSQYGSTPSQLDLSDSPSGVYRLVIQSGDEQIHRNLVLTDR